MTHTPIPWVGLAALIAMFIIPFLPDWLFEGPRTIKHRPRRHICGDCNAPWTDRHTCSLEVREARPSLQGQLRRLQPSAEPEHRATPIARRPVPAMDRQRTARTGSGR
jgi:hypothetical protein